MERHGSRHRLALKAALALAVSAALVLPAASAAYAAPQFVALGDSFSAGVGTRDKQNDCYQSPSGYPVLVAERQGYALSYQACSGATTSDVAARQLGSLSGSTSAVTMTIGGNDVGFAPILIECAKPGWMSDCKGAIARGRAILQNELPARYDSLFGSIRQKAPSAKVAVAAYPRLFNGEDCNALTFFSPAEQAELNQETDALASLIQSKSTANGFTFVDPRAAFDGRAVCDSPEWINGLSSPVEESYHPNKAGNVAYAGLFSQAFGGKNTERVNTTADSVEEAESREPSTRKQADAVLALALDSEENLQRAEDSGVDPNRIRALVETLKSGSDAAVAAALEELRTLDR